MNHLFDLTLGHAILLVVCLALAFAFEFVNGFHDTANAVATVIYTNTLKPRVAVVISGVFNFLGVLVGGLAVALAIMKLLPIDLLVKSGTGSGIALVLALLLSAIIWNLGTWFFGLPASSSHALIGSILGVGIANSLTAGHVFGDGVNWAKAREMMLSLLISPLAGFVAAGALYLLFKRFSRNKQLMTEPPLDGVPPPMGTRAVLIGTCGAVSFAHGSNDGQKGVGLVMLILIGLMPAGFAIDTSKATAPTHQAIVSIEKLVADPAVRTKLEDLDRRIGGHAQANEIPDADRFAIRQDILEVDKALDKATVSDADRAELAANRKSLRSLVDYSPTWVVGAIALALGLGTMVGWKRIVETVGKKIGKSHLTYAQGMSAELVAATAIGIASTVGLPVSTTHVLSSGVAGTMVAQRSGLNKATVRNIALAWLLTLPVTIVLAGSLFLVLRQIL